MERHHLGVTRNALRENRLVIFGLCSVGLRRHGPFISCHIFHLGSSFFLRYPKSLEKDVEHFEPLRRSFFFKPEFHLLLLEGVAVRRSLTFKIGFRIMNGGSWTKQQHATNERIEPTTIQQFPESFQPSLRPNIGMAKDMVVTTRHLL